MCRAHGLHVDPNQVSSSKSSPVSVHAYPRDWRRRSADIGGLHLALAAQNDFDQPGADGGFDPWTRDNGAVPFGAQGQGWMGGEPGAVETFYAELLSDMYRETLNSVNDNSLTSVPPSIPDSVRSRLIWDLNRWHFEPQNLNDDEVLACTLLLFEALFRIDGMREAIPISMEQITSFVHHLRRIYRYENTYHNFEHALDVLQATQSYLKSAGVVPPPTFLFEPADRKWASPKNTNSGNIVATLGHRELFMLYIAAIGHDVGHPGFTNMFMKNAKTPLSMVFDHRSALENMHCQLLLVVMRHHGLGVLLDDPQHGKHMRKILVQSVLATDMGVHNDFMERFRGVISGEMGSLCMRQVILCQAILKNADISNPTRPFLVSRHWASMLIKEWIAQAQLEEEFQMQPTVMSSFDPLKEANSQIFFIETFAKPLLELTEKAVPEMRMYVTHCKGNLKTWRQKKKILLAEGESGLSSTLTPGTSVSSSSSSSSTASISSSNPAGSPSPASPRQVNWYNSAFPLTLPTHAPPSSDHSGDSTSGARSERDQDSVSMPDSPTESVGSSSAVFSPVSETSSTYRAMSTTSNAQLTSGQFLAVPTPHAAIRAATKVGSMRKKSQTNLNELGGMFRKSRNSWCASPSTTGILSNGFISLFQSNSADASSSSSGITDQKSPSAIINGSSPSTLPPSENVYIASRSLKIQVNP